MGVTPWEWVGWVDEGVGWDDSQISNLQTELKYLDLLKFYHISIDLGVPLGGCGYGWMWGEMIHRFQIFKQNSNILVHSSFITFQQIWGPPFGGWVGVGVNWLGSLQKFKNFKQN